MALLVRHNVCQHYNHLGAREPASDNYISYYGASSWIWDIKTP